MFDTFLYYWLLWIIFIMIAFFMENSRKRLFFLIWILTIMISSPYYITLFTIRISIAFCFLIIGAIIFFALKTNKIYHFFATFTCMLVYISLLIWENVSPVWYFMPSYIMIPFVVVVIILFIVRPFYDRLSISFIGISLGQLIYELILISYNLYDVIDNDTVVIYMSIVVFFITMMNLFEIVIQKILQLFARKLT